MSDKYLKKKMISYQWFCHDDTYFAFRQSGEVGEQAFEDILARFGLGVHGNRHGGNRTFPLTRSAAHLGEGALSYGGCWESTKNTRLVYLISSSVVVLIRMTLWAVHKF